MAKATAAHSFSRIGVIGGGAWGTALAQTLRMANRDVSLWARDAKVVAGINAQHANNAYLPDVALDAGLKATTDLGDVASADLVLLVTPAQVTRAMAEAIKPHLRTNVPIVICAKGIEQSSGKRLSTVLAEVLPTAPLAVLSGQALPPTLCADYQRR